MLKAQDTLITNCPITPPLSTLKPKPKFVLNLN
jgi:hypothetical protein